MRAMVARVSSGPPRSVRFQDASNSCLRGGAVGELRQQRLLSGVLERDHPLALEVAGFGSGGCRLQFGLGKAGQLRLVAHHQCGRLGAGQELVHEFCAERGLFLIELLEPGAVGAGELGARVHELLVVVPDEPPGFGAELEAVTLLIYSLHALEQPGIEEDRIIRGGQLRRDFLLHPLQCGIGVGGTHAVEDSHRAVQQAAALLQRHQGVIERGRRRVVGDLPDLRQLTLDACLDGRQVVAVLDLIEGRRMERQGTDAQQRIRPRRRREIGRAHV